MTPVFLDANIPMYAAGAEHPLKAPCQRVMSLVDRTPHLFVTNAEVFQEIIHHYLATRNWRQGREVFARFKRAMRSRIESVHAEDADLAAALADLHPDVSARDLVHAAVMRRLAIGRIVSADGDFDYLPGIERLDPMRVDDWAEIVVSS